MGFTIDMNTGDISDITNGINSKNVDDTPLRKIDHLEPLSQEQLLPVTDTINPQGSYSIPGSLIDCDVETFIKNMKP